MEITSEFSGTKMSPVFIDPHLPHRDIFLLIV